MKGVALLGVPVAALVLLVGVVVVVLAPGRPAYGCSPSGPRTGDTTLTSEQWRNARTIATAADQLHVPTRGVVIAVATALQESGLQNLDYGDRDSRGLFQQRPSMGWGSPTQVTDLAYAARAFFAGAGGNRGLLDVPGWEQLPLWLAADSVQHSAYPGAYADHEAQATAITQAIAPATGQPMGEAIGEAIGTDPAGTCSIGASRGDSPGGAVCPPVHLPVLAGLTPDARQVVFCVVAHFGITDLLGVGNRPTNPASDHPAGRAVDVMIADYQTTSGRAMGDAIAAWCQAHAAGLGITYVIWNARIWSVARSGEGWRPYAHPSGATDDTSLHRNHVHVSVTGTATVHHPT